MDAIFDEINARLHDIVDAPRFGEPKNGHE